MPGTVAVPVCVTSWHKQRPSPVISSPSWPQSLAHTEQVALSCHRWGGLGRSDASLWAPQMLRWEAETGVQVSKLLMPGGFPWWMACPWCWQTCLSAEPPVESLTPASLGLTRDTESVPAPLLWAPCSLWQRPDGEPLGPSCPCHPLSRGRRAGWRAGLSAWSQERISN